MSFFKALERNVFRPIGRAAKSVAPVAGTIAGGALGGPMGAALGSTLGGMAKRGKVDLGQDAMNFGGGLLMGGVASKLGIPGMGGGSKVPDLGTLNAITPSAGGGMLSGIGNWLKDGKNLKALGDTALGGYSAVQQEREFQRRRAMEDEQMQRNRALDPMRSQLLQMIMQRMGASAGAS